MPRLLDEEGRCIDYRDGIRPYCIKPGVMVRTMATCDIAQLIMERMQAGEAVHVPDGFIVAGASLERQPHRDVDVTVYELEFPARLEVTCGSVRLDVDAMGVGSLTIDGRDIVYTRLILKSAPGAGELARLLVETLCVEGMNKEQPDAAGTDDGGNADSE